MRRLGFALLVTLICQGRAGAEPGDPWDGEEADAPAPSETQAAKPAPKPTPAKAAKPGKKPKAALHWARKPRRGAKLMGAVVPDEMLRPAPAPRPTGNLHL